MGPYPDIGCQGPPSDGNIGIEIVRPGATKLGTVQGGTLVQYCGNRSPNAFQKDTDPDAFASPAGRRLGRGILLEAIAKAGCCHPVLGSSGLSRSR